MTTYAVHVPTSAVCTVTESYSDRGVYVSIVEFNGSRIPHEVPSRELMFTKFVTKAGEELMPSEQFQKWQRGRSALR